MINMIGINSIAAFMFYFTVYSFFGWLLENSYSFITTRKFFKEGFLRGPFKPMYGFAPILLVLFITRDMHWSVSLFLCLLIPTIVEYVSGFLLNTFLQRRWWDYTNIPLQLHGHICLSFSFCWIFLSVICLTWVHPALTSAFETIQSYWVWLYPVVTIYFIVDLLFSIKRHLPQHSSSAKQPNSI